IPSSLANNWSRNTTLTGLGAIDLSGRIIASVSGGAVQPFLADNATPPAALFNLGGDGRSPLIGWDGVAAHAHYYLPRNTAVAFAIDANGNLSWELDPNGATHRAFSMDCSGRLFGASNN